MPDLNKTLFIAYLESNLWPTIAEIIGALAPELDQDRAQKLHYTISSHVTDRSFEDEWMSSGFRPSADFEANLRTRIARLVNQLRNKPVRDCPH